MSEDQAAVSNEIQPLPDPSTPIEAPEPKKISKLEEKRQRIFQERMHRLVNGGKTPQQAFQQIQKEDYERLSLDKKVEIIRTAFGHQLEGIAQDLARLHGNQRQLADIMDVNFRAYEAILMKLGATKEDIVGALKTAEQDVLAEQRVQIAKAEAEAKAKLEESQKKELANDVDQPGTPAVPEGATVFGG